jgi:excisionase family DNA binding protein
MLDQRKLQSVAESPDRYRIRGGNAMGLQDSRRASELPPESSLLTVTEVSQMMRVSKMTVYRLVRSGELPAVRIGKILRIPKAVVQSFLGDAWKGP